MKFDKNQMENEAKNRICVFFQAIFEIEKQYYEQIRSALLSELNENNIQPQKSRDDFKKLASEVTSKFKNLFIDFVNGANVMRGEDENGINIMWPSKYDLSLGGFLPAEFSGEKIILTFQPIDNTQKLKFVLKKDGVFKIIKSSYFDEFSNKWKNHVL